MTKHKYIWIIVVALTLLAGAPFSLHEMTLERTENTAFVSNLENFSQEPIALAQIDGFRMENENNGSFNVDGNNTAPSDNEYYTNRPVSLKEFASSTDMTTAQVDTLIGFAQKYPYIEMVEGDVNTGGKCTGRNGVSYSCTAVKFYLQHPFIFQFFSDPAAGYSSGYMYIPFALTSSNQAYLSRYFKTVTEIAPNWYAFSGEHF